MKKLLAIILALTMILALVACGTSSGGNEQTTNNKTETDGEKDNNESNNEFTYKVGFINIQDTDPNCSWTAQVFADTVSSDDFAQSIGYDGNVEVSWLDSENSVEKQTGHFENLVAQDVDMVFCIGVNNDGNAIGVRMCNDAVYRFTWL